MLTKKFITTLSLHVGLTVFATHTVHASAHNICMPASMDGDLAKKSIKHVRFATFNVALNRSTQGQLLHDLSEADDQLNGESTSDVQTKAIAEIIQRVRPDILLLNEFDFDERGEAIKLFKNNFLTKSQNGQVPIDYAYVYFAPSNTGIPSHVDFDNDGNATGQGDAFGFGVFTGQYGMVLLSQYPILAKEVRTFQYFLWKDMPNALLPDNKNTKEKSDYYSDTARDVFRLSSKSHWDIPILIDHKRVHVLAAHPTPPVFDGEEDRNGARNHDEIRFWADYIKTGKASAYIYDDKGHRGGLHANTPFVIMGDYNADMGDGDSTKNAIGQLTQHPQINTTLTPGSFGALADASIEGGSNITHVGNAAFDTGDFDPNGPGNLRIDYVLPSKHNLNAVCGGVFWPTPADETYRLVGSGHPVVSSDHHMVWMDVELTVVQ